MRTRKILKAFFFLSVFTIIQFVNAQEYITFPNGTFIKAKIVEISSLEIKYKLYNSVNDQVYSVPRNQVYNVRYENGTIDFLNGNMVLPTPSANLTNVETFKTTPVATNQPAPAKKSNAPAQTTKPVAPSSTATAALPADLSKQLNLTPEQLQLLKKMLDENAAAAATQQSTTSQPTTAQSAPPAQVQPYSQSMVSAVSGGTTSVQNPDQAASVVSSLLGSQTRSTLSGNTGKIKRPTAFRDYKGHLDIGGVWESPEFLGFSFLGESSISKSDFGFGVDANFLSNVYTLNKYDLPTDYTYNFTDIGLRLSYHIPVATFIDPYIAVRGFYYEDEANDDSDFDTDLIIGARLMYKKFGLFYEFHFNYEYARFGVSFSL